MGEIISNDELTRMPPSVFFDKLKNDPHLRELFDQRDPFIQDLWIKKMSRLAVEPSPEYLEHIRSIVQETNVAKSKKTNSLDRTPEVVKLVYAGSMWLIIAILIPAVFMLVAIFTYIYVIPALIVVIGLILLFNKRKKRDN